MCFVTMNVSNASNPTMEDLRIVKQQLNRTIEGNLIKKISSAQNVAPSLSRTNVPNMESSISSSSVVSAVLLPSGSVGNYQI